MKIHLHFLLLISLISTNSYAEDSKPPHFMKGENYASVRGKLLKSGWKPYVSKMADSCNEGDERCQGRPEMLICAAAGAANCKFLWIKNTTKIGVCTIGESAVFDKLCQPN